MMVKKPIGPVKIDGFVCRLSVGRLVPPMVRDYWQKTGEISELIKAGIIEDDAPAVKKTSGKGRESIPDEN